MILWIIGIVVVVIFLYMALPNILIRMFHWRTIFRGPNIPAVSLTFDDGPDRKYTPRVLDALRNANVHATFFVIAEKASRLPDLIERMIREGHDVQIHGYTHACVPFLVPPSTVTQVSHSTRVLREFGIEPVLYRPPWGLCNLITLLHPKIRTLRLTTWSVMVGDWRKQTPERLLSRIVAGLHPGAVIVLHDSDATFGAEPGAPETVIAILPKLAKSIRDKGWEFHLLRDWR